MGLTPELKILIINATACAVAYFALYPSFRPVTLNKVLISDVIVTIAVLTVAGGLYWGTNMSFKFIVIPTNWFIFSLVTFSLIELPLFWWLNRKYDLL